MGGPSEEHPYLTFWLQSSQLTNFEWCVWQWCVTFKIPLHQCHFLNVANINKGSRILSKVSKTRHFKKAWPDSTLKRSEVKSNAIFRIPIVPCMPICCRHKQRQSETNSSIYHHYHFHLSRQSIELEGEVKGQRWDYFKSFYMLTNKNTISLVKITSKLASLNCPSVTFQCQTAFWAMAATFRIRVSALQCHCQDLNVDVR